MSRYLRGRYAEIAALKKEIKSLQELERKLTIEERVQATATGLERIILNWRDVYGDMPIPVATLSAIVDELRGESNGTV
jgi:hypothetical protein